MKFTTSWDDGYALDLRLADLLRRYGFTGTFYPCPAPQLGQKMITEPEIRSLSDDFEIGAHTLTHPRLSTQPLDRIHEELTGSKQWIEGCTNKVCSMFCYPKGDITPLTKEEVRRAGFHGARTTEMLQFQCTDAFALPTSLHVYPLPFRQRWTRAAHFFDLFPTFRQYDHRFQELHIPFSAQISWIRLAKDLYRFAAESNQTFFHLWGHSAEIEKFNMWKDLERFLIFVTEYDAPLEHVPNSKLLPILIA